MRGLNKRPIHHPKLRIRPARSIARLSERSVALDASRATSPCARLRSRCRLEARLYPKIPSACGVLPHDLSLTISRRLTLRPLAENDVVVPAIAFQASKGTEQKHWQNHALEHASATGATNAVFIAVRTTPNRIPLEAFHGLRSHTSSYPREASGRNRLNRERSESRLNRRANSNSNG